MKKNDETIQSGALRAPAVFTLPESNAFSKVLESVFDKSPMQKKRILKFLREQDDFYWEEADKFGAMLFRYLEGENIPFDYAVETYMDLCAETVAEQMSFMKTGKYSCILSADACKDVYSNPEKMKSYMHGVLLTQFLWKNHFLMMKFYLRDVLGSIRPKECLEIGVGHGLLLSRAINKFPEARFRVVDISPISIAMANKIIRYQTDYHKDIEFIESDIREFSTENKFDYVIMGEVLEHVEDPLSLLRAVKGLLSPDGCFYMTTCANCPAIDHVYCFNSVEEIIDMIHEGGFRVLKDIALPVDDVPRELWTGKRVGVNYAGLLAHS